MFNRFSTLLYSSNNLGTVPIPIGNVYSINHLIILLLRFTT
nr:MAG TPA: hypothetical protein [Caudoviricetes sp.]